MKKIILSILFLSSFLSLKCNDNISEGTIPFIFDRHLYLKITLNDTISATIIYDTGADFLYLDEDYLKLNNLQDAFGKKGFAKMGGAGNSDPQRVTIFIDPVKINFGNINYRNKITPVIKLRDILGRHTDGLLGNTHILSSALEINFSNRYIKQLKEPLSEKFLDKYTKLEARFEKNRIDVKAKLEIDSTNTVEGWFRVDLGSGGSVSLTNEITSSLNLDRTPKAYFETQAGGIGGGSEEILLRAKKLCMADTIENIVIKCSLNKKGALSSDKPYLGLIGNKIWSLYDIILDPANSSVYVKRNNESGIYSQSSTTQMEVFDRTDICDGWIINGLYKDGIAEQAGLEIGDIIIAINDRPVKEITWEEQRKGIVLKGKTKYTVKKKNGNIVTYILFIKDQII